MEDDSFGNGKRMTASVWGNNHRVFHQQSSYQNDMVYTATIMHTKFELLGIKKSIET